MHSRFIPLPQRRLLLAGVLLCQFATGFAVAPAHAAGGREAVACHVTYGGETRVLRAASTPDPYRVEPTRIGSYFLLRIVFEAPPAPLPTIKIYTYANLDEGPLPIHVAEFPYPPSRRATAPGFTGVQRVYEPVRDGELEYWCALSAA